MLATATRYHAPHAQPSRFSVSSSAGKHPAPERVEDAFIKALRNLAFDLAPLSATNREKYAADEPDLMGLASDVWAALSSNDFVLDVRQSEADLIFGLPLDTWAALRELCTERGVAAPVRAGFGVELARGSPAMAQGLRLLGVQEIDVLAPVSSRVMYFNARSAEFNAWSAGAAETPWNPTLSVSCTEAGTELTDIYVNDGAVVVGYGFEGRDVLVHYTDEEGYLIRTEPLKAAAPDASFLDELFVDLRDSMRGRVLDLSGWTGEQAQAALQMTQHDWANWRASLWKDVLDLVLVGPELDTLEPLVKGVDQLCTLDLDGEGQEEAGAAPLLTTPAPHSSEDWYLRADQVTRDDFHHATANVKNRFADFDSDRWFDRLLDCIDAENGSTLNLAECPQQVVDVLRDLTPAAWDALLRHPDAASLNTVLMSPELYDGGLLPVGLAQVPA